jgi:putative heme-binding domain-containing protein
LASKYPLVQATALDLVRLRGINTLSEQLQNMADNEKNSINLRMGAISALLLNQQKISEQHFSFLYKQLKADQEAPIRQQAANVLTQGKLTEQQQLKIATDYLPEADAFILPRLVPVFRGAKNSQVGKALATTLINSPGLDSFNEENMQAIFASYPSDVNPVVEDLLKKLRTAKAGRLERLQAMERQIPKGDLERGRALYFGKAACFTCHTVGAEGGNLGPDLTSIQRDRSAHDLLEAIVYPSATFVREYETYKIKTKNNEYTGILKEQTPDALVLGTSPQNSVRILRNEIISTEILDVSMMPQGLDQLLTEQEMADLMAFLLGQDQDPETDQAILR